MRLFNWDRELVQGKNVLYLWPFPKYCSDLLYPRGQVTFLFSTSEMSENILAAVMDGCSTKMCCVCYSLFQEHSVHKVNRVPGRFE